MKIQIGVDRGTYTFNPATRTVVINGLSALQLEQVLLITNVTTGAIIYNFADPSKGSTSLTVSNQVVTLVLTTDTTSMSASDRLQIFVNYTDESVLLMRRMVKLLEPVATVDSSNRQIVAVGGSGMTVSQATAANLNATVTGTVTPSTLPVDNRFVLMDQSRSTYQQHVRSKITFS